MSFKGVGEEGWFCHSKVLERRAGDVIQRCCVAPTAASLFRCVKCRLVMTVSGVEWEQIRSTSGDLLEGKETSYVYLTH